MNNGYKLTFRAPAEADFSFTDNDGKRTLGITVKDKRISCEVFCSFKDTPLILSGEVVPDEKIEIILMPHRVELHTEAGLQDEEWPAGRLLFGADNLPGADIDVTISGYSEPADDTPSVADEFVSADGWRPSDRVFVGDCMPYVSGGRYHVLYLKDRHHHHSKWGLGAHQWEHISTSDFVRWQIHPMAVAITDPIEGSICTGSWIGSNGADYLFYTVRMSDGSPAPIRRSIAHDGYHFAKDADFSVVLSEKYHRSSARDPKVIAGDDGLYHMFLTTSLMSVNKGCLAHLISSDLDNWSECEAPIYLHSDGNQPECPDYIKFNGFYYLIYSICGRAHYMYSTNPFDGWQIPADPIIPCSSVPKGAVWGNRIIFTGFEGIGGYAGNMVFRTAKNTSDGELIFD